MDKPQSPKEEVLVKMLEHEKVQDDKNISVILPSFISKKLASWILIREDLLFAKSCSTELLTAKGKDDADRNTTIEASLWYSLIITYGKCFTENQSGRSRLEEGDCFNNQENFKQIHENIMDLRHGFIAHRGDTENEQAIVYMKIPKTEPIAERVEYKISSAKSFSPSVDKIHEYIILFDFLLNIVQDKIQKQADKIDLNFLTDIDPKYLKYFIL